jgi:membrane dipeptidase
MHRSAAILTLAGLLSLMASAPRAQAPAPSAARAVHEGLLTLDGHLDAPANFGRPGWDIMDRHSFEADGSQVDYPRMVEGGLDGGLFAVFTAQGPRTPEGDRAARDAALLRTVEIREMVSRHRGRFGLALTADDAAALVKEGKRFVFISMENSYPIGQDLSLLATFHALGLRVTGLAHFKNNDMADSATDKPEWGGLSPLGQAYVAEANRLGMVIDGSHSSDAALDQMMALSKTPILLTHSGVKAVYDHPRNLDDARLRVLAAKGGVIQILAFTSYMMDMPKIPQRDAALAALTARMGNRAKWTEAQRAAYLAERKVIDARYPVPRATFDDFMKHLLHALKVAGVDHVGIGVDFDGGGGVAGLEDASDYWRITEALLSAGYSRADLEKIWSGNVLRLMRQAEAAKGPVVASAYEAEGGH